jgi:hypothetical protein
MAKGDFVSRANAKAAAVQDDKDAALKALLKQDGGGRTVNEVNDFSPQDLRAAVDNGGLLDRNGMVEELALVDGVSSEEADEQTSEESDSAVFDRVWDSRVKREAWQQAGHDAADYRGDDIGLEEFLLHRAAELRAADREATEELIENSDPRAGKDYGPGELSDEELAERLNAFEAKQLLGDEDNPLDPETIIQHQKGDLRGELNELGVPPEETRDMSWEELVLELDRRRPPESGTPPPPEPEERESIPRPDPPDGTPTIPAGDSPPTTETPKVPTGGTGTGDTPGDLPDSAPPDGGGDTGGASGSSSGTGGTGGGSEPSGPPAGSVKHYLPLSDVGGPAGVSDTAYKASDGKWYRADGSPLDDERAKQFDEHGKVDPSADPGEDSTADDSTTDDATTDAADTELTPVDPDAPTREDIDRYRAHIPDQGVAPTRNQGATDPSDPSFDDGLGSGEIRWGRDSPSDSFDERSRDRGEIDEDLGPGFDPEIVRRPDEEFQSGGPGNPGDVDTTPRDDDLSHLVPGTGGEDETDGDESPPEDEPPAVMVEADLNISGELPLARAILPADALQFGAGASDDEVVTAREDIRTASSSLDPIVAEASPTRTSPEKTDETFFGAGASDEPVTKGEAAVDHDSTRAVPESSSDIAEPEPDPYLVPSVAAEPDEELVRGGNTAESEAEIEWQPEQVTRYGVEEESDLEKFVAEEEAASRGSVTPLIDLPDGD